jgi:hypothetical protein
MASSTVARLASCQWSPMRQHLDPSRPRQRNANSRRPTGAWQHQGANEGPSGDRDWCAGYELRSTARIIGTVYPRVCAIPSSVSPAGCAIAGTADPAAAGAQGAACSCRGARRGAEGLMRRRVSVLLDPLQTPQEARRPLYRRVSRETLGGTRARPRGKRDPAQNPESDSTDGTRPTAKLAAFLTKPAPGQRRPARRETDRP